MQKTSIILTLTGKSSHLEASYFPPIQLSKDHQYVLGLTDLLTYNSIPNIHENANSISFGGDFEVKIPTGCYEFEDIVTFIEEKCEPEEIEFKLTANTQTFKCELECSREIDFTKSNSIGKLFGFNRISIIVKDLIF